MIVPHKKGTCVEREGLAKEKALSKIPLPWQQVCLVLRTCSSAYYHLLFHPAFQVTLSLIQPEVVLTPSTGEVTKQLVRMLRNLAESSKAFVRWMDGSCLECPEQ